jgi:hypothetical protein
VVSVCGIRTPYSIIAPDNLERLENTRPKAKDVKVIDFSPLRSEGNTSWTKVL